MKGLLKKPATMAGLTAHVSGFVVVAAWPPRAQSEGDAGGDGTCERLDSGVLCGISSVLK